VEPGGKNTSSRSQSRGTPPPDQDNSLLGPIFETARNASNRSHKWSRTKPAIGTRSESRGLTNSSFGRFWWANRSEASSPSGMSVDPAPKVRAKTPDGKPTKAWWRAHSKWIGYGPHTNDQYSDISSSRAGGNDSILDEDEFDERADRECSIDELTPLAPRPSIPRVKDSIRRAKSRGSIRELGSRVDRRTLLGEARKTLLSSRRESEFNQSKKGIKWDSSVKNSEEEIEPGCGSRRSRVHSVCLEWKGGVLVPQTPQERVREDVKLMGKKMQDSMMASFDRTVWEDCGLQQKVKATVSDRPDVTFMTMDGGGFMRNFAKNKKNVGGQDSMEMEKDELMIASLAKKTGMSVLDVEEIWEVFQKYDLDGEGRINIDGPAFELLIVELGQDPRTSEVIKMREDLDISVDGCADFVDFYLVFMSYLSTTMKL